MEDVNKIGWRNVPQPMIPCDSIHSSFAVGDEAFTFGIGHELLGRDDQPAKLEMPSAREGNNLVHLVLMSDVDETHCELEASGQKLGRLHNERSARRKTRDHLITPLL